MAKKTAEELAKKFLSEILESVGLEASSEIKETDDSVSVDISGDDLGALIGYHGETLASLQLILSLMVNKNLKSETWKRLTLDIGNWRAERNSSLKDLVTRVVEQIEDSGEEKAALPAMSAAERREVHVIISEAFPDYESVSEGEEPDRRVLVVKKEAS